MFNPQKLYEYIQHQWQENILTSLFEYIKIPNKSPQFDPDWQAHGFMEQAINHVADWCRKNAPKNMSLDVVRLPGRTPLIFMEIPGNTEETVLLYGHLDKQPEMTGWHEDLGPWKPVIKDGRLYGRGGADDGYSAYASLTAIRALEEQGLPLARCIVIIEACEESGSYDLPFYIDQLKEKIGQPSLIICLDSGAGNYEQLWMTTSLRGNVSGELTVEVLKEGVHSGAASGIVPDSFRIARQLLSRIEDENTGEIKLKSLYCEIPEDRKHQAVACAEVLGESVYRNFPFEPGMSAVSQSKEELILNRSWRPALTVTGASGLPSIADAGNVLRPKTSLKLSMRLPPLISPELAASAMEEALSQNPPYHAKVSFKADHGSIGWNAPRMVAWLEEAVNEASMAFYQKPAAYIGEGGTIPFMGMLGEKFPEAQFMITGVLGPHSNAHGPNEFLHLEMVKKLTSCVAFVLHSHFQQTTLDR
ncbi:M20 family metallopeptidase [Legionella jordanis]|uniref:Succinyl-diaminopimelate desuccinylase n=1 Tax=Legionella jordanis TaxID=456 RepID=A0A0W0VH05_9GAMM|nr:M20 family metallopeptidase [Legionella jordanis]KTD18921.1 succinyl-diaminopimelate desuccinylase [Legionella jordanis]RMX05515.1 M20/M25/M40 family metallo-hydrolase [Legionella jordanis]RMX19200.1 M20/M25/M40 family metallo-hydrolase [Legionella jordanis]VEH13021.1 succinyl-diaminopimelate desuccinylase [Legionella jordanis]